MDTDFSAVTGQVRRIENHLVIPPELLEEGVGSFTMLLAAFRPCRIANDFGNAALSVDCVEESFLR